MRILAHFLLALAGFGLPGVSFADEWTLNEPNSGVIGGIGLYLVKPYFGDNLAYTIERENQNPPVLTGQFHSHERVDIEHGLQAAPLVWLGYVADDGLGGRARFWSFRAGTDQFVALPPSNGPVLSTVFSATPLGLQGFGDTLFQPDKKKDKPVFEPTNVSITSKLELNLLDLEALQSAQAGDWDFLLSGGIRLARIKQEYNFYNFQPTATPLVLRELRSRHDFEGAGPVLALQIRRLIGATGLTLFTNGRGALLFGEHKQEALFGGTRLRNNDANPQYATDSHRRAMSVVELEIGVEYGVNVGRSWLFGQVALVGQDWLGAGNASRSASNTFREGAPIGGVPNDADLAFLGVAFRLGWNY